MILLATTPSLHFMHKSQLVVYQTSQDSYCCPLESSGIHRETEAANGHIGIYWDCANLANNAHPILVSIISHMKLVMMQAMDYFIILNSKCRINVCVVDGNMKTAAPEIRQFTLFLSELYKRFMWKADLFR